MTQSVLFERFKVIRPIGEGGMGSLFLVEDITGENQRYALKIFKRKDNILTSGQNAEEVSVAEQRFHDEFTICQKISHPNVVKAYEYFEHEDVLAYTMEYIDGYDLSIIRDRKNNKLSVEEVHFIAESILSGLKQIHALGQIHRDLKPENILIDPKRGDDCRDWIVKVSDLGLAKKMLGDDKRTAPAKRLGTAQYMSPEYLARRVLTPAHDIFSFGIILYELFTNARSDLCFFDKHGQLCFRKLEKSELAPIPKRYQHIMNRSVDLDSAERYQNVEQVLVDLDLDQEKLAEKYNASRSLLDRNWIESLFGRAPMLQFVSIVLIVSMMMLTGIASFGLF